MANLISRLWVILIGVPILYIVIALFLLPTSLFSTVSELKDFLVEYGEDSDLNPSSDSISNRINSVRSSLVDAKEIEPIYPLLAYLSISAQYVPIISYEFHSISESARLVNIEISHLIDIILKVEEISEKFTLSDSAVNGIETQLKIADELLVDTQSLLISISSVEKISQKLSNESSNHTLLTYVLNNYSDFGRGQKMLSKYSELASDLILTSRQLSDLVKREYILLSGMIDLNNSFFSSDDRRNVKGDLDQIINISKDMEFVVDKFSRRYSESTLGTKISNLMKNLVDVNSNSIDLAKILVVTFEDIEMDQEYSNMEIFNAFLTSSLPKTDQVNETTDKLRTALNKLSESEVPFTGRPFSREFPNFIDYASKSLNEIQTINEGIIIASDLVGVRGGKKYLLLAHSADELRATGGFISGVWLLEVKETSKFETTYYDVVKIDDLTKIKEYPSPPPLLQEHMGAWVWLFRDVSWPIDFTESARNAQLMFQISQNIDTDGVIGFNQYAVLRLLEDHTLNTSGDIVTKDLISQIEEGTDTKGREYMNDLIVELLDQVIKVGSIQQLRGLTRNITETLDSHDLMIFAEDAGTAKVLSSRNWDGSLSELEGYKNFVYLIDSNIGWNKVDRNIQRHLTIEIAFDSIQKASVNLTLNYINHSGPSAAECEPQWIDRGDKYSELLNGCYWNLFRLLIPSGSKITSHTKLLLPQFSASVNGRMGTSGEDTVTQIPLTSNVDQLSGLLVLDVGSQKSVEFNYLLPDVNLARLGTCVNYPVFLKKQPGVPSMEYTIMFKPVKGYTVEAVSVNKETIDDTVIFENGYSGTLVVDSEVIITMKPNGQLSC